MNQQMQETTQQISELLARAVDEVLGTMFYVFGQPVPAMEEPSPEGMAQPWVKAWIGFEGPAVGQLTVFLGQDTARTLAANFMGRDAEEGVSEEMIADTVRELLNMISGRLMVLIEPEKTSKLGLPLTEPTDWEEVERALDDPKCCLLLDSDEGVFTFKLDLEPVK